jgi:CheY-like chemotaxis protein
MHTLRSVSPLLLGVDGHHAVEGGGEAGAQAVGLAYDAVQPGVMNGLQVLDIIKADPRFKDIFVRLMTARGQIKDGAIAKKRGADAYFVKPFSPADVVAWVDSMLHSTLQ